MDIKGEDHWISFSGSYDVRALGLSHRCTGEPELITMKRNVYTVAVVGASGIGKTSFVHKLCYGTIPLFYEPTIEDLHTAIVMTEMLDIVDTSSDSIAAPLRRATLQHADAVMFLYDAGNPESTDSLPWQLEELCSVHLWQDVSELPLICMVVGLRNGDVCSCPEGERFAHIWGLEHVTANLQSAMSVRSVFEKCVFLIEERAYSQHKEAKVSCCTIL